MKLKNKRGKEEYEAYNNHKMMCGAALSMKVPLLQLQTDVRCCPENAGTVKGKLNQTNLVEFYLQKTGMVKLKNKDGVREYKAINYHKMTCGAALNMRGPILEYLKTLLEQHEEAGNKVILIFFFVLFNVFFW